MKKDDLKRKALQIRRDLLTMIYNAKTGHTGGSLSSVDILVTLYYEVMNIDIKNPKWQFRDRFIMSKGHSVEGLYCVLADKGFYPKDDLKTFSKYNSNYIGHPNIKVSGVEANTGALGHGLSIGVGTALAAKMDNADSRVFVLMGDGEQAEGSVWEAALSAANYKLDNLVAIIDRNMLQISGTTEEVMALEKLKDKYESFGWSVKVIDGHDFGELIPALKETWEEGKPQLVLAKTTKGKGISYMENVPKWHHGVPDDEQFKKAMNEFDKAWKELN